jgi:c(7)-type cytochrome triheme protein
MHLVRNSPRWLRWIAGVLILAVAAIAVLLIFVQSSRSGPQQPVDFNHQRMVGAGIPCLYCHGDAMRGPSAGIPSVQQCMGCHNVIATELQQVQELAGYWERREPIPWVRIYQVPRFVFFTHQVHVSAGFNCENCHGDVGNMAITQAVADMNMGWCLSCHNKQPNATQLKDCVICHR